MKSEVTRVKEGQISEGMNQMGKEWWLKGLPCEQRSEQQDGRLIILAGSVFYLFLLSAGSSTGSSRAWFQTAPSLSPPFKCS